MQALRDVMHVEAEIRSTTKSGEQHDTGQDFLFFSFLLHCRNPKVPDMCDVMVGWLRVKRGGWVACFFGCAAARKWHTAHQIASAHRRVVTLQRRRSADEKKTMALSEGYKYGQVPRYSGLTKFG